MLKVLIKQQFLSLLAGLTRRSSAKKKQISGGTAALFALLFVYLAGVFGVLFYHVFQTLCAPLLAAGLEWLYFVYAVLFSVVLSVFGGVFMAATQLYEARDNELLLSMPIPPRHILFCRMLLLYAQNFLLGALPVIPAYLARFRAGGAGAGTVAALAVMLLILPLLSLFLTCVLGFLVALLTSRMRHKNIFTVVLSLIFIAGYYYLYFRFNSYLTYLLANSDTIGARVRSFLPVYALGRAGAGSPLSLIAVSAAVVLLFALLYFVLSATFIRIATAKRGAARVRYREGRDRRASAPAALLRRERMHFFASSGYMLNTGLSFVILLAGGVFALVRASFLREWTGTFLPGFSDLMPLFAGLALLMICALDAVSASSVSLEGRSLWIVRSLPVDTDAVLTAKLKLHFLVTGPAGVFCAAALAAAFRMSAWSTFALILLPAVSVAFMGELGLMINLRHPNLNFTNETVVVKQGASAGLTLLSGFGVTALLSALYFAVKSFVSPALYLLISDVLFGIGTALLSRVRKKQGCDLFETL